MITDKELSDAVGVLRSALNESRAKRMKQESKLIDETLDAGFKDEINKKDTIIDELKTTINDMGISLTATRALNVGLRNTIDELEHDLSICRGSGTANDIYIAGLEKERDELKERDDTGALRAANATIHNAKLYIGGLEAELKRETDSGVYTSKVIIGNLRDINTRQHKQIREHCEIIDELKDTIRLERIDHTAEVSAITSTLHRTINELKMELSARKDDSRVLMQVVEAVKMWKEYRYTQSISQIATIVENYLDASESPVVTLKTPSLGTRVVSKNEEAHTIDETTMKAVRMLLDCDGTWVLYTEEEAVEVMQHKTTIGELKRDLDARNKVIKDFKAIETKETDRLHADLNRLSKIRDELLQLYCDRCDQLEKIDEITKKAKHFDDVIDRVSANHTAIDEIIKIIQEE